MKSSCHSPFLIFSAKIGSRSNSDQSYFHSGFHSEASYLGWQSQPTRGAKACLVQAYAPGGAWRFNMILYQKNRNFSNRFEKKDQIKFLILYLSNDFVVAPLLNYKRGTTSPQFFL
jgi:hypothetical protein